MRRTTTLIMISLLAMIMILSLTGCKKEEPMDFEPTPIQPKEQPQLGDVGDTAPEMEPEPAQEMQEEVREDAPIRDIDEYVSDLEVPQVGTRIHNGDEEPEAIDAPEGSLSLTSAKLMVPDSKIISVGETVVWKNDDSSPHLLIIEKDGARVATGSRIEPGQIYSYTFTSKGRYDVRDMWAGAIRGTITVE